MRHRAAVAAALICLAPTAVSRAHEGLSAGIGIGGAGFVGRDLRNAVDPGPAGSVFVEFGITDDLAVRAAMIGSIHRGGFPGAPGTATSEWVRGFRVGPAWYFLTDGPLQPLVEAGIGVYGLSSTQGFYMMSPGVYSPRETSVSWGVDVGTGIDYYVRSNVSVGARVGYLYIDYPVTAPDGRTVVLRGDEITGVVTLTYHFGGMGMHGMMHHHADDGQGDRPGHDPGGT